MNFASCAGIEPQVIQTQPPHHHRLGLLYSQRLPLLIKANTTRSFVSSRHSNRVASDRVRLSVKNYPVAGSACPLRSSVALTWTLDLPTNIFVKDNPGKSGAAARSVLARCRVIFLPGPHKANRSPPQSHPQTHGKIPIFKSPKLTAALLTSSKIRPMSPTTSGPEQDLFFPSA